jgi:hypothetical protein
MTAPAELAAPSSANKPLVPLIAGITLVTKDEWSGWTGGKANHTWTGLDSSIALLEHTSSNQLCPVYVSAAQKGYNFRRTGHKISFKPRNKYPIRIKVCQYALNQSRRNCDKPILRDYLRNFFTLLSKKYKHIWDYPCDMKE